MLLYYRPGTPRRNLTDIGPQLQVIVLPTGPTRPPPLVSAPRPLGRLQELVDLILELLIDRTDLFQVQPRLHQALHHRVVFDGDALGLEE